MILATVKQRVLSSVIDTVIILTIFCLYVSYLGNYVEDQDGLHKQVTGFMALLLFVILLGYFVIPESLSGKSFGKAIIKIKVVKQDGAKITFGNSLVRHLFDIIDWLPFCFIVYIIVMKRTEHNQRVGDIVAKTIVIQS